MTFSPSGRMWSDECQMAQNEKVVWLSAKEAANRCGISLATLYQAINDGRVPAYQISRSIKLKELDVEEFVERSRIEPGALDHLVRHTTKPT